MKNAMRLGAGFLLVASVAIGCLFTGCAGKAKAEPVKLVYWSMWNQTEPQGVVLEKAIRDFETKNPGVTVEINDSVLFAPGQALLQPAMVKAMQGIAEVLAPTSCRQTIARLIREMVALYNDVP